jgi:hypothetical protein
LDPAAEGTVADEATVSGGLTEQPPGDHTATA